MSDEMVFLYIDDNDSSREIMEFLLMYDLGYEHVTIWEDSADFIERIEGLSPQPNLIFLDIHMKPYTGFEVLEGLRQHPDYRDTVILAMTASVMSEEVKMLKEAGFDGAIGKPIDQEGFQDVIQRVMRGERVWRITG